jgi:excisionase family DNA binding protein
VTSRSSNRRRSPSNTGTIVHGRPVTRLRTIDEAADLLNVSPRTVRRLIESGALRVHRFGRLVRIADGDLAAFLAASRSV